MRILLAATALFLAASTAQADAVDDLIKAQMARSHIPGAAVAVVEDGKITKLQGYGTAAVEWNASVDADTPFQIASGTKIITGVLLMRLVEKGEIRLEDPVGRYIADAPESWRGITVRHLAEHTSGISEDLGGPWPDTTAEFVTKAKAAPLAFPTGSESRYGLVDYVVLRAVLEKASGLELQALMERELIRPLGLTHTMFNQMRDSGRARVSTPIPGRAVTYGWSGTNQEVRESVYPEATYAAGGLFSSARDLAKLFAALDNGTYLKAESLLQLTTPATLSNGGKGGFGVGWTARTFRGQAIAGHSGGPALADMVRFPNDKRTVIVLTNQFRFYPLLAEAVAGLSMPPAAPTKPVADVAPAITETLKAALAEAAAQKIDPARYNEKGRNEVVPYWRGFGLGFLDAVGPYQSATLVRDKAVDGGRQRTYLVRFEAHSAYVLLKTDAKGLIEALYPVGESD